MITDEEIVLHWVLLPRYTVLQDGDVFKSKNTGVYIPTCMAGQKANALPFEKNLYYRKKTAHKNKDYTKPY